METFMYTVDWWTIGDSRYFMAVTLTLLSLIYLSTMLNTFQKTKLLGADSLRAEERALLRQFTVFCGCYALESIFEFSINTLQEYPSGNKALHLISASMILVTLPIPISYVLCLHYRSFKNSYNVIMKAGKEKLRIS